MTKTANRRIVEDYYRFLGNGDNDSLLALHDVDMVYAMAGGTVVSGRHKGLHPFLAHIGAQVLGKLDGSAESFVKGWRICVADEAYVVGLLHGGLPVSGGGRYDQNYLQIFRIADGRIAGVAEFFDTAMVETAPLGNGLAVPRDLPGQPYSLALTDERTDPRGSRLASLSLADRLIEALAEGDEATLAALHADCVINIAGRTPVSGRWNGMDPERALVARLAGPARPATGPFRVVCADERAICLMYADRAALAGTIYDQCYGVVYEVRGGRFAEAHKFFDTVEAERVLFGNPLREAPAPSPAEPFDLTAPI